MIDNEEKLLYFASTGSGLNVGIDPMMCALPVYGMACRAEDSGFIRKVLSGERTSGGHGKKYAQDWFIITEKGKARLAALKGVDVEDNEKSREQKINRLMQLFKNNPPGYDRDPAVHMAKLAVDNGVGL